MNPVISVDQVSFSYGAVPVLEQIDLQIDEGEFIGVVGPNGGGKTTLLKLVLGLLKPESGQVRLLGGVPEQNRTRVGYVPQFARFAHDFPLTAGQVVLQGRLGRGRYTGGYSRKDNEVCERVLREAAIPALAQRQIGSLSGGEMQRVLIARALAVDPEILLLDEPTSNIDQRGEQDIFDLLASLNKRMTVIVVSHDIAFISPYVGRIACLNRTLVCHRSGAITGEDIQAMYGGEVDVIHHHHMHSEH